MKTYTAKTGEVEQGWYVVDAQNKVLGRLASQIALRLRGKHKPEYTPHIDTGDFLVVINVDKLRVTGRKLERKIPAASGRPALPSCRRRAPSACCRRPSRACCPRGRSATP